MLEEGIGEFADLGVIHLEVFIIEVLHHDPLVARHEAAIGFKCCNNVSCLDGFVCQRCSLFGESDAIVLVLEECKDQQCSTWVNAASDSSSSRMTSSMHAM